jgi:hypothetical protein
LTASHYFREIIDLKIPLFVGSDPDTRLPIPLLETEFHMGDPTKVDVAVATLTKEQAKCLRKRHEPISISQLKAEDHEDKDGVYVMCGFPQVWMHVTEKDELASTPLNYGCSKYEGDHDDFGSNLDFNPRVHCLFDVQREGVKSDTGEDIRLPAEEGIKGISGCGIWKVGRMVGTTLHRAKAEDVQLCAIEHHYHEGKGYVIGTWIHYAVQGIVDRYPDLRKAFDIVYP